MVFSSILFLTVFFPLFILIYFALPKKLNVKHAFFLLSSFIFYGWGAPKFVFVIFFTTIIDFYMVKKMNSYDDKFKRKLFLCFPILLNTGLLCYFKYFNFFMDNINAVGSLVHLSFGSFARIMLPIGISFYTFESITYSVDVYRRVHAPLNKFWEYQMYIIFFPKLIAGPIVRYHEIADQIQNHLKNDNFKNRINGFIRFCIGLSKKVLIANVVAQQADAVFALQPDHLSTTIAWVGALAYTLQIYFDFSGYSDMAIGISKMLGFTLPENFNNPYVSKSVTEFWRRWHITLGNWMKNYLYIPLGGNRVSKERVLLNLFIVFVLSGLWHGAGWNFILWGVYYGLFLVLERISIRKNKPTGILSYAAWIYTFLVVVVGWVLFRVKDVHYAWLFILKMFSFDFNHTYVFIYKAEFLFIFIIGLLFSFCTLHPRIRAFQENLFTGNLSKSTVSVFALVGIAAYMVCLISLSNGQFNPFIYFKF
jgi:alginate O-acetyltransferase complex protein AlgI